MGVRTMSFTRGTSRYQIQMFTSLDEMILKNNAVRLIDEFVNGLNLLKLGVASAKPNKTGRPPYTLDEMLKIWIYGYCNSIRSSRKLEKECFRNIEMMWLVNNIRPDHSSIASFRKTNSKLLKTVFREFTLLCVKWDLICCELLVVDGTKIKANNSKKNNYSETKLSKRIKEIDKKIENYLSQTNTSDDNEVLKTEQKIQALTERKTLYNGYLDKLKASGESQLSTTDKDSRLMDNKQGSVSMGYNIQATVDAKNDFVVDVKVTNHPTDQGELSKMCRRSKIILKLKKITTTMADKGYYNGKDLTKCKLHNITAIVPRQDPPKCNGEDGYTIKDFTYNEKNNSYTCPTGNILLCRSSEETKCPVYENRKACKNCKNIDKCTKNKNGYRKIVHSEYFAVQREADKLFEENKKQFKKRQEVVEHPFGTVKYYLGVPQLLLRTKKKVTSEISLLFFSYNFKRAMNILGFDGMMARLKEVSCIFFKIFILETSNFCNLGF